MTILLLEVSDASHSTMEQETVCLAKRHSYSLGLCHTHTATLLALAQRRQTLTLRAVQFQLAL